MTQKTEKPKGYVRNESLKNLEQWEGLKTETSVASIEVNHLGKRELREMERSEAP